MSTFHTERQTLARHLNAEKVFAKGRFQFAGARTIRGVLTVLAPLLFVVSGALAQEVAGRIPSALDEAFDAYWAAPDPEAAAVAANGIRSLSPGFDAVFARLRKGRTYSSDVPRGVLFRSRKSHGLDHGYMILVPESYDPSRSYGLRWDLHGGMGQPAWKKPDGSWSPGWAAIEHYENDCLTVVPSGWWGSMWWEASQADNFRAILDEVKRTWNIREDRVWMFGGSDGAVGEWFYAFRDPDPWAFYIGYVGFPVRLTNRKMRADGQMHLSNLERQRFYLRNAGRDRIVNIDVMRQYMELFKKIDVEINYEEYLKEDHSMNLTHDQEYEPFVFFRGALRDPLPEKVSWSTERVDRYNRRLWLVIDELDPDAKVDESNILPRFYGKNVPRTKPPKPKAWGRVELERKGNTIYAQAVGVTKFRLLLAPSEIDFAKPVRVHVNGKLVLERVLEQSVDTLLTWAARDDDRSLLFGAELVIVVPE